MHQPLEAQSPLSESARRSALEQARERIDRVDSQIVRLLETRAELSQLAQRAKASQGQPRVDREREKSVIDHAIKERRSLSPGAIRAIYAQVLRACRGEAS